MSKVEVDKTIYEIPEDEKTPASKIYRMFVNFLMRGKILVLPKYQRDIYCDEASFWKSLSRVCKGFIR